MNEWGRDPLQILIERESRLCKGCAHIAVVFERQYCSKGKKMTSRCHLYQEVKNTIQGKP